MFASFTRVNAVQDITTTQTGATSNGNQSRYGYIAVDAATHAAFAAFCQANGYKIGQLTGRILRDFVTQVTNDQSESNSKR